MTESIELTGSDFAQRLSRIRRERGLTREELAERAGGHLTSNDIWALETRARPALLVTTIIALAEALDVDVETLRPATAPPRRSFV